MAKADGKNIHAIELGRLGRAVNSPLQQEASRINGRRGGAPKGNQNARKWRKTGLKPGLKYPKINP